MSDKALSAEKHDRLLAQLHAPDEAVRVCAALRLTGAGVDAERVRPTLETALCDPDAHVRRLAAWVLARLGLPRHAA
jgi:HEAT repeat protein